LQEWRPDTLTKTNNYLQVFQSTRPSLALIKKELGNEFLRDLILLWLLEFNEYINNRLTDTQLHLIARDIEMDYYYYKPDDLAYLFKQLKQHKWVYCSLAEFSQAIKQYDELRCQEAVRDSQAESEYHKSNSKRMFERQSDKIQDFKKKANYQELKKKYNL